MNELGQDLSPRYIPTKFHHDPRRITRGRALTKCDGRTDRQTDKHGVFIELLTAAKNAEITNEVIMRILNAP